MFQDPEATRLLAISPHLDDAVLSIGGGLAQAAQDGAKVTVYTVFAGTAPPPYSPVAERMHAVWGLSPDDDAPLYRRKEDVAALDHLGVSYRHGRFLDSIYRTLPDGRWLADHAEGGRKLSVSEHAPDGDPDLVAEIKDDIKAMIDECASTLVVTCAAIGGHPDHEAARDAALLAAREKNIPIRLWEDLPYAVFRPASVELPQGFHLGSPDFSSVATEMRTRKFQAVECYVSQLAMLDGNDVSMFDRLDEHARKTSPHGGYGETTWPVICKEDDS
ncbi:PIG-L deacetylase family protein [Kibdelosporangium aridum]|uniref:N-acetylglucosaminyl deacetylase, LmbE family n=1 Tax=Kibdelosporangium aridum TaxID=2030 RepID=A0A1W2FT89_KIBAR|nr:PIG-L family deacetylase [Kibdelosporangium aridum]SMD25073.1 N-acetylglucosaminyl deacetylase, LmbE family [Kibdelosporangium aridum]